MKKQSKPAQILETLSICLSIVGGMLIPLCYGSKGILIGITIVLVATAWAILNTVERR